MKSILIADDEEMVARLYATVLGSKGYEVLVAKNGEEAVALYKRLLDENKKPDIVIMDYRMPLMDGVEATKEILSFDCDAKIIFASADASALEEVESAGGLKLKIKPIGMKNLISNVESLI